MVQARLVQATNFAAGFNPVSVAVGDFNGNTFLDPAVAGGSNNVSILLGTGTGSFGTTTGSAAGFFPRSVAVGNFNGDTFLDLAVSNSNSNNVSILLGNGTGSFCTNAINFCSRIFPTLCCSGRL